MNMKKNIKRISVLLLMLLFVSVPCLTAHADTIYYDNGLLYTYLNNDEVTICGAAEDVTEVKIPNYINYRMVVDIRNRAFLDNTTIESVDFSNIAFLRRIGSFAFSGCSNLSGEVIIPNTVTTFDTAAFQNCTSLESVIINAQNGEVSNQCFQGCTSLSSVSLNDSITRIGYYAFDGCTNLEYLEIPATVTEIANTAFRDDDNIVLGVYKDTYAHTYAQNKKIDHIVLDGYGIGDVNFDGVVDVFDATEIQKYAAEMTEFTDEQFELGDINKDGYCDVIDALLVQKSVVGKYVIPQNIIRY